MAGSPQAVVDGLSNPSVRNGLCPDGFQTLFIQATQGSEEIRGRFSEVARFRKRFHGMES